MNVEARIEAVRRSVQRHGGAVMEVAYGRYRGYVLAAPSGQVWADTGRHWARLDWPRDCDPKAVQRNIEVAIGETARGLKRCTDAHCGYCRPRGRVAVLIARLRPPTPNPK